MAYDYDLVVIGAGPAGEKGAAQAAYFGKRVACIEREAEPGGAAVHTGTLPSKTLRETALFLSGFRQREFYGLSVDLRPGAAIPRLMARKNAVIEAEVARLRWNLERHGVALLRGAARFVDAHTIDLLGAGSPRRLTAEFFLVATGSRPFHPPGIPFDDDDVDDSDTILQLDRLPRSMLVVGGGVIGCEYASIFAALGVAVTLVEGRARLLQFLDLEIAERLRVAMQTLGVTFRLGRTTRSIGRVAGRSGILTVLDDGSEVLCEKVLASSGRSGATEHLGLEAIGVQVDARGTIAVDGDYRTSAASVYAAGDVIGFPALASTSMEQARVAVCHAFGIDYKRQVSRLLPFGIYTIPEVSSIGLSEEAAREQRVDVVVGRALYRDNARGKIVGDRDGVLKLVVERATRKVAGCHCIGERASELVHVGQAVMVLGGTVDVFLEMVFNHPTLGELFKYAAYDALGALQRA